MAVRHQLYHTRHEGRVEESTVTRLRQRSPVVCPEASHLAREKRSQHRDAKTPYVLATRRTQHQLSQEIVHRLEACMFAGVRAPRTPDEIAKW